MDQLLSRLPKSIVAFLVIAGGTFLIILSDPPKTVCDAQWDILKQKQEGFTYLNPKNKGIETTQYEKLRDRCKVTNSPGGCYPLFEGLENLLNQVQESPVDCQQELAAKTNIRSAIKESTELMVQLAWGGSPPPNSYYGRRRWLSESDLITYCNLKQAWIRYYSKDNFDQFRERMFTELPGIAELTREEAWNRMILSENCRAR